MDEAHGAEQYAADIAAGRDRMLAFTTACPAPLWKSQALLGQGDPRPVGVVVDHVADAYEYLAGWIREIAAGADPAVGPDLVDDLNARHAAAAGQVSQQAVADHLRRSGDAITELVAGLAPNQLDAAGGRARRLAQIAARHADDHRAEIEAALRGRGASAD